MSVESEPNQDYPRAPYDDIRSYIEALRATGNLIDIDSLNQDGYESTALAYRLTERYGISKAPAFLIREIVQDGRTYGPLLGNAYGPWAAEAIGFGVEDITDDHTAMYRAAQGRVSQSLGRMGFERIAPVEVAPGAAPVKSVVHTSPEDVDLFNYGFIKSNPADNGRYITTPAVILHDEKLGYNVGTYRCQIKSGQRIGANIGVGQDGWNILMAHKARGATSVPCAIAIGTDPILWGASCSKLGGPGSDEYSVAGGLRGRAIEVVKAETSDLLVPAHAELIVEGEIPLYEMEPEGPFAELYGHLGPGYDENFFMNVRAITHRVNPIIVNAYTGIERGFLNAPAEVAMRARYSMSIPGLVGIHLPIQSMGVHVMSVKKTQPGQGLAAGLSYSSSFTMAKVVIVVDDDVDIYSYDAVMRALSARWQPSASVMLPQTQGGKADPSITTPGLSSKMVIDATRQWPIEGGPVDFAPVSRQLLLAEEPDIFARIDSMWPSLFNDR